MNQKKAKKLRKELRKKAKQGYEYALIVTAKQRDKLAILAIVEGLVIITISILWWLL